MMPNMRAKPWTCVMLNLLDVSMINLLDVS
jgi:hypothetical protein